jgi:hypothetical protein
MDHPHWFICHISAAAASASAAAGLVGHGVLGLVELAKSTLAAEGAQIVPASATLYCMGVELLTVNTWDCQQQQQQQQHASEPMLRSAAAGDGPCSAAVDLRALDAYRQGLEP